MNNCFMPIDLFLISMKSEEKMRANFCQASNDKQPGKMLCM
jgi:hypothetical protein